MGDWKVIAPTGTTNKVLNSSGEIAGNFAALAGTTVARDTTYQHYGLYSYRVQSNADNEGMTLTLEALGNVNHWVTLRVSQTLPTAWDVSLDDTNYHAPALLEEIDTEWSLYGVEIPAAQANGSTTLHIRQNGAGSGDFYVDGVQVEQSVFTTWTTFCDGTQPGCEWNGTPHASSSARSAESRAGGIVYDLEDDYGLRITGMSGTGTAPQELFSDSYSQLPGGELNAIKTNSRVFTLTGVISEDTEAQFYEVKQTLESLFDPEAYPEDENGPQPVRLRFNGAAVHKEIAVHYEGGLEANITANDPCAWERVAVRFLADDPYWSEIGESAALLDTEDSATFTTVAARLRSTGQWSNLGPPNAAGTYVGVYAMAEDSTYVYLGGSFQNFDNIAAADYIVRYNKSTGVYSALGSGLSSYVYTLAVSPSGLLYIGGEFLNAGGVAAADYLCTWDGSNFAAVGTPNTGTASITRAQALVFDGSGNLYIGGIFTNWADIAAADKIVMWNGSAYSALSTGLGAGGAVQALALALDKSTIYIGGSFTVGPSYLASWNGSSFTALNSSLANNVTALAVNDVGILYYFTQDGNLFYSWNGTTSTLIGTANNFAEPNAMKVGPDGILYAGGQFSTIDGLSIADRVARYNGYAWAGLDINLPGTPTVSAVMPRNSDPVVPQKYDLWVGFNTNGTGTYAGLVTTTNGGTAPAFPQIIFSRSGGTSATIETLKNERTGKELLFNYSLLDGETLTIDLTPTKKSISSNFFGSRQDAVLANSDFGDWSLLTGSNDVSSFVAAAGSPTVTAWMLWKEKFKSQN